MVMKTIGVSGIYEPPCMIVCMSRVSIMSFCALGDGFLHVCQLLRTSCEAERGDHSDGQLDL